MTLTRFGLKEWGSSLLIALVLIVIFAVIAVKVSLHVGVALVILTFTAWCAVAAFFRNPGRVIPDDPKLIVSPADGVVKDIEMIENHGLELFGDRPVIRIGVFLSIFDVHLNRIPSKLIVKYKNYRKGRYLDARSQESARKNEAMTIGGVAVIGDYKFPLAVRQISGALARRIVCPVTEGDMLERGSIYGMIKFGSRTELYIPAEEESFEVLVKVGDRVLAGASSMAKLRK
ncbi:phosphatidylserine decarboxylase [Lentisphaerota bacterium ZTH]|nr:phosphatidylserine decarboxylase family protein [Lentisphaerota bacterium]WET07583.1 phosphatidylserine decarboxylase [Lentisphaerota bacterium ZTH]